MTKLSPAINSISCSLTATVASRSYYNFSLNNTTTYCWFKNRGLIHTPSSPSRIRGGISLCLSDSSQVNKINNQKLVYT